MLMHIIFPIYAETLNIVQSMNTLNRETDQRRITCLLQNSFILIFKETWDLPERWKTQVLFQFVVVFSLEYF